MTRSEVETEATWSTESPYSGREQKAGLGPGGDPDCRAKQTEGIGEQLRAEAQYGRKEPITSEKTRRRANWSKEQLREKEPRTGKAARLPESAGSAESTEVWAVRGHCWGRR